MERNTIDLVTGVKYIRYPQLDPLKQIPMRRMNYGFVKYTLVLIIPKPYVGKQYKINITLACIRLITI